MDTLTIAQYAAAHKVDPAVLVEIASERAEAMLSSDAPLTVAELDDMAAVIDETAADDLRDAMGAVEDARADLADAERRLRESVREALGEGMAATRVAEVLGVSRARVYQLRDNKR